jgi:ABC-type antimicrobial peptide transport system permease subunit
MPSARWEIGQLKLRPEIVWAMAISSLKVRLPRTMLTTLTISTATAFMMWLLVAPTSGDLTERQSWAVMLVLCLIVSGVGVLNTMLMSVTQRYREIGTIKCLGGLDSLVLYSTLLEAAILGLVGGIIGAILGVAIGFVLALADYGGAVLQHFSLVRLPVQILIVFGVGMLFTTMGAAIPAWIAAKMPPIEAMRGEK